MLIVCCELLWRKASYCGLIVVLADAQKPSIKGTYASFFIEKHFQDNKLVIKDEIEKKSHWGLLEYSQVSLVLFVPQVVCLHYSELKVYLKKKKVYLSNSLSTQPPIPAPTTSVPPRSEKQHAKNSELPNRSFLWLCLP